MRPNLFANTPDILHEYLQHGGRPAFQIRLVLAATLGASYGIYSGYELAENVPVQAGQRGIPRLGEIPDPRRNFDDPNSLAEFIAPRQRRSAVSTRRCSATGACGSTRPTIRNCSAYSKRSEDGTDLMLTIVTLDPVNMQHGFVQLPLTDWGLGPDSTDRGHRPALARTVLLARRVELRPARSARTARTHPVGAASPRRWLPSLLNPARHDARRTRRSALVQGRRHLPGARARLLRQHQRRRRRLPRPDAEARVPRRPRHQHACGCCRSIRRRCATMATTSRTTRTSIRATARSRTSIASSRRRTAATSGSSPSWSSTTPRTSTPGSRRRAARRPARPSATSTSGARPTGSTTASGSSSPTPRRRTGAGTTPRRPTTGIASSITSRI